MSQNALPVTVMIGAWLRLGRNKEVPTSCERYRRSNHESVQIEISTVRREALRSIIGFLPL